jgi:hypothetical protein
MTNDLKERLQTLLNECRGMHKLWMIAAPKLITDEDHEHLAAIEAMIDEVRVTDAAP